jgi:hypothetical protein
MFLSAPVPEHNNFDSVAGRKTFYTTRPWHARLSSGACFSLRGLVVARREVLVTKPRKLKRAPLKAVVNPAEMF